MNANKILSTEFAICLALNSWPALKNGQVPWAGTISRTSIAFAILAVFSQLIDERLGVWLASGFMLALLLSQIGGAGGVQDIFGAQAPVDGEFYYLRFLPRTAPAAAAPAPDATGGN